MPQIAPLFVGPVQVLNSSIQMEMEPIGTKDGLTSYTGTISDADGGGGGPLRMPASGDSKALALQPTLTLSISRPSKTSRLSKVRIKLVVPVATLDANGQSTNVKSHENSADMTYLFSEKSTEAERSEIDAIFAKMLEQSPFPDVIRKQKSMY